MTWFNLPRVPEPEAMDDAGEVEAYSSAAAQAYLGKIDDTLVEHALRLAVIPPHGPEGWDGLPGAPHVSAKRTKRLLDLGAGPGQITRKLAQRLPGWHVIGIDHSSHMIRQAMEGVAPAPAVEPDAPVAPGTLSTFVAGTPPSRVEFLAGDANRLPFADAMFDVVLCNSVLHHLAKPASLLAEITRVVKATGAILVCDLRRPSRLAYPLHVRWYGRHYSGLMYKLYCDSVRSAYTADDLAVMLRTSPVPGARIFTRGRTHLGLERPAT